MFLWRVAIRNHRVEAAPVNFVEGDRYSIAHAPDSHIPVPIGIPPDYFVSVIPIACGEATEIYGMIEQTFYGEDIGIEVSREIIFQQPFGFWGDAEPFPPSIAHHAKAIAVIELIGVHYFNFVRDLQFQFSDSIVSELDAGQYIG